MAGRFKSRPIGDTQRLLLKTMGQNGGRWFDGCGWYWMNRHHTVKLLESLAKRGLVRKTEDGAMSARAARNLYELTEEGRAHG